MELRRELASWTSWWEAEEQVEDEASGSQEQQAVSKEPKKDERWWMDENLKKDAEECPCGWCKLQTPKASSAVPVQR